MLVKIEQRTGNLKVPDRNIQVRLITADGVLEASGAEAKEIRLENQSDWPRVRQNFFGKAFPRPIFV